MRSVSVAILSFYQSSSLIKTDRQAAIRFFSDFPGNYRVKVGILGAGVIGSRVAELLKPFDMEVLAFDPFWPDEKAKALGVRKTT